ncbi:MAG TPA: hypothetical protein VGB02_10380 [Pyrinomonadaceae bacterium]|jgi:hypothetical protein
MDDYQLGKDIQQIMNRLEAIEKKLNSKDCGCGGAEDGSVVYLGMAEKTDQEADPNITTKIDDTDRGAAPMACTDGHLRRVTVNGVCYCQMCCGGQWVYFCYSNGQCIQCPGRVTVNCAGNNWILSC